MRQIGYALAVFLVAARRLWYQRGLALSMLSGLVTAIALTTSIPIYAEAVSYRILGDRLYSDPDDPAPPFSFLFRYVGSWSGYLEWEACQQIDGYITNLAASTLGLPQELLVRHYKTDQMRLFPASDAIYADPTRVLSYVSLGFISDLESHVEVVDGRFPRPATNTSEPMEVLVSAKLVGELGIQAGEDYIVHYQEPTTSGSSTANVLPQPVRVAGIWRARDPQEDFWFYGQSAFEDVLLVPEASYLQLAHVVKGEVGLALWSLVCSGDGIRSSDVAPLLGRMAVLRNKMHGYLYDVDIARSPERVLGEYRRTVLLLTVALYVFGVPVLGLVLYFTSLVSRVIVRRQRNEIAILRSRGTAIRQVVGIYLLEGLIVGGVAIVAGSVLGLVVARILEHTRSFLVLQGGTWNAQAWLGIVSGLVRAFESRGSMLAAGLSWANLRYGILALAASLVATVLPSIGAARDTVVTYKQDRARSLRAPLWQRARADLLLLVPALYGYYLLRQRGTIAFLETDARTGSPFSNPYLFLVPVLLVFALGLMSLRLFPWVMRFLAWVSNAWRGVVLVIALRHLSRMARYYSGPVLLLIITLSLAVFTASMARTLDDHTVDRVYYDVGADYRLVELGESTQVGQPVGADSESNRAQQEDDGPEWLFLPVSEHLYIPGVQHAARVWSHQVTARIGGSSEKAALVGIDRIDIPLVAAFRRDFAPASLGALMNALSVRDDAVLVSRDLLELGLEVGDAIELSIPMGTAPKVEFRVAGVVDRFPRRYPKDGAFFIANLDFIFNSVGGMYPYDVWLKADPSLTPETLLAATEALGINVMQIQSAGRMIEAELLRPERQGVFGLLSAGFVVSAFLTVLGFLIYSYVSFSQRYIELGVLRAIGLSVAQMAAFLIVEQLVLIATGAALGTGLGVLVSRLFIPFYQVQGGEHPFAVPFVVQVAWGDVLYVYAVLGAMFVAAVVVLLFSLRRMRIFEAVKLGETT